MNRRFGSLTAPEISSTLTNNSILCLPIGACEQHGPHLPLETDTIIAEQFTARLIDRYGDQYDLWAMPSIPYGLSLEHAWSAGTISLRVQLFVQLLDIIVAEYVRTAPARKLLIVNGHGGNRGILEAITYELETMHSICTCVLHPSSLSMVPAKGGFPEVHGGMRETSVLLALSPDVVHLDRIPADFSLNERHRDEIQRQILYRGTTWPWLSDDPRISCHGLTGGDPRLASAELGEEVITSALDSCDDVLMQLSSMAKP